MEEKKNYLVASGAKVTVKMVPWVLIKLSRHSALILGRAYQASAIAA